MDINELARVIPKNVTDWSNKDVLVWLDYIHLPQLSKGFRIFIVMKGKKILKAG